MRTTCDIITFDIILFDLRFVLTIEANECVQMSYNSNLYINADSTKSHLCVQQNIQGTDRTKIDKHEQKQIPRRLLP